MPEWSELGWAGAPLPLCPPWQIVARSVASNCSSTLYAVCSPARSACNATKIAKALQGPACPTMCEAQPCRKVAAARHAANLLICVSIRRSQIRHTRHAGSGRRLVASDARHPRPDAGDPVVRPWIPSAHRCGSVLGGQRRRVGGGAGFGDQAVAGGLDALLDEGARLAPAAGRAGWGRGPRSRWCPDSARCCGAARTAPS